MVLFESTEKFKDRWTHYIELKGECIEKLSRFLPKK